MKHVGVVGASAAVGAGALLLAGCSQGEPVPEPVDVTASQGVEASESGETVVETGSSQSSPQTSSQTSDLPEPSTAAAAPRATDWRKEYEWVLDHPDSFPVTAPVDSTPSGVVRYALIEATSDDIPELLLFKEGTEYTTIQVFTIGPDGKAYTPSDVLLAGSSSRDRQTLRIDASASGNGLYQVTESYPGESAQRFLIDGNSLRPSGAPTEYDGEGAFPADQLLVRWDKLYERSALYDGTLHTWHPNDAPM